MSPSDRSRLDLVSGVTATDQGSSHIHEFSADNSMQSTPLSRGEATERPTSSHREEINEEPNEASTRPLTSPQVIKSHWTPPDVIKMVLIVGILVLLFVSILVNSPAVTTLLAVITTISAYFFGKATGRRTL